MKNCVPALTWMNARMFQQVIEGEDGIEKRWRLLGRCFHADIDLRL
jgi:hypothetical protein